ncbi:hypothetical protein NRA69_16845 [Acinetobacter baumannii]|uniref:virulence factor TspB C-terminal domain-related protein n=1 Tax=Acinetobacter baumannii TaxID=470 RepID=UPI001C0AA56C|nr:virulence factor TspB C-terminal domain-related protein [Acinetobacter baumannii]MBU3082324.1 hypothetical protein [Acinetobacter baumannii]MDC5209454.1 virulence factor TspB C-terminal domain-related protein [Acinetobacter baumannii]MDC5565343.1 hypothetical protein [Acinetobacter baumannii]
MIHRINIFLLSLFVALTPNLIFIQAANATTVAGEGWSVTKRLVQGATTFYDGTKNVVLNGKNYLATGAAAITPTASQVSKMIVRTGAVFAVDLAIKALIGAVDYTMDPANNRVIYYPTTLSFSCTAGSTTRTASSLQLAAQSTCQAFTSGVSYQGVNKVSDSQYECLYQNAGGNQSFTMSCSSVSVENHDKPEYLPYDAVASQIISDAASENSEAKAYVSSVADTSLDLDEQKQIVPATDVTQQLNNSQAIPTSNTAQGQAVPQVNPDDPTAPKAPPTDITINFPVFCEWAPTVCQAANAAINFPKLFLEKFQKWDDWINRETKPYTADETKIDTEDKRTFDFSVFNTNRFSVDDKCPTPEPQTITVLNVTTSFTLSLQPVCSILELAKPALIACSYIYAAYIVIGAAKGG